MLKLQMTVALALLFAAGWGTGAGAESDQGEAAITLAPLNACLVGSCFGTELFVFLGTLHHDEPGEIWFQVRYSQTLGPAEPLNKIAIWVLEQGLPMPDSPLLLEGSGVHEHTLTPDPSWEAEREYNLAVVYRLGSPTDVEASWTPCGWYCP